jgi:NADP-dependent 3-hydroxy acid dehydrogenase YdfG
VGRNNKNLAAVKEEVAKITPKTVVLTYSTDITDPEAVQTLFENIGSKLQTVDVLVNNAGAWGGEGPVSTVDVAKWWRDFVSFSSSFINQHC